MYEAFYGFKEKPFTLTPDPRYFYPSHAHREALDHLLYGIREREGFIVITGDVGTGKTTLCRAILSQLNEATTTAVILNPVLSEEELLRTILQDFGLSGAGRTKNELLGELNAFLIESLTADRRAVLIVDEAQNLSRELLEQIRLLSNLETERDKLIQIVLVGQLELLKHLDSPELKQLNQRISVRYSLAPLSYAETCQYIYHRLMVAGGTAGVSFDSGALRSIYQYSRGIPRLINLSADRALLQGFADQTRQIRRRTATAGIRSLVHHESRRLRVSLARVLGAAAGITLGGVAAAWLLFNPLGTKQPAVDVPAGHVASQAKPGPAGAPVASPAPVDAKPPRFSVLVSTFATLPEARALERRLADDGFPSIVARPSGAGDAGYSVLVGPLPDMRQAEQTRDRLAQGNDFPGARIVRMIDGNGLQP